MKNFKLFLFLTACLFFLNCYTVTESKSSSNPDFKVGKAGFEKRLKRQFDFDKLSIGFYTTKKNGLSKENGLNLTFKINNLENISDSLINSYTDVIKEEVKTNLLHFKDYNYINITFENELTKGNLRKVNSIKIKKQLN